MDYLKLPFKYLLIPLLTFNAAAFELDTSDTFHQIMTDEAMTQAARIVASMTTEQKVARKLMMDFRHWCEEGVPDEEEECKTNLTAITQDSKLAWLLQQHTFAGIVLFAENIVDFEQTKQLVSDLQQPLIAIDQEGGNVVRLPRGETASFSGNMAIGAASIGACGKATCQSQNAHYARRVGGALGQQLRALGINVNFAPVVDVNSNSLNPVINVRAFSDSPAIVANYGAAMVAGIQNQGIAATLKHFPGHGNTALDSHFTLPLVEYDYDDAMQFDIAPFADIIQKQPPDLVMTAHIQYPKLVCQLQKEMGILNDELNCNDEISEDTMLPATFSYPIQQYLLREKLGFTGVSITDALYIMQGISDYFTPLEAVINTFKAGVDLR